MFANQLPPANLGATAPTRSSSSSTAPPSPDSANAQFARLLEQQAAGRRDAERADANRQANNAANNPANNQSTGQAASRAARSAQADADAQLADRSALPGQAATARPMAPTAPPPRPVKTPDADSASNDPARPSSATARTPAAAAGKPVVDGDDHGNSSDTPADEAGKTGKADASDGTVCGAPLLAPNAAGPDAATAAAAAAAAADRSGATPTQLAAGPETGDGGPAKTTTDRTPRRAAALGAAADSGAAEGRDSKSARLLAAGADRPGGDKQPGRIGSSADMSSNAVGSNSGNNSGNSGNNGNGGVGETLSRSFAAELQALVPGATSAASATTAADAGLASAGAPADVPTEGRLHASPGTPEFAGALGAQLTTFVADGVHHARLELNPADMGPVTVQIRIDGQQAQVHLAAAHADTRLALEQALPQLAGSLRETGLTLSGGGVYDQPQQQQAGQPGQAAGDGAARDPRDQRSGRSAANGSSILPDTGMPLPPRSTAATARRGVVDLVA